MTDRQLRAKEETIARLTLELSKAMVVYPWLTDEDIREMVSRGRWPVAPQSRARTIFDQMGER